MGMKSITISAAWSSLMGQEKRRERLAREQGVSFDALYQQYYPVIFAFLHFLVGTPEVAEDLASLVFEKVWMHLTDIQALDTAAPWLFRIARNCATDYFRRCKPATSLECLLPDQHPRIQSLEENAIAHEEERILLAHLSQLSEREREVIGLKFAVGMNNRQIAHILQLPEGTVSSLLHRALRRLRAALDNEGGHHEILS
jgi:RNA polymerase sigma-70 factor (ECF subfamily)